MVAKAAGPSSHITRIPRERVRAIEQISQRPSRAEGDPALRLVMTGIEGQMTRLAPRGEVDVIDVRRVMIAVTCSQDDTPAGRAHGDHERAVRPAAVLTSAAGASEPDAAGNLRPIERIQMT
jgi:hypothetical protein